MPAQYTLPPDSRAVGSPNPPADMDAVVDAHSASGAVYNVLNAAYGTADPTGTTDSTAAIQAALNAIPYVASNDGTGILGAARATLVIPGIPGGATYLISSGPLVLPAGVSIRITGSGDGTILKSGANAILDLGGLGGLLEGSIEIDHLGFDATGGHVFQNASVHGQLSLHDLAIRQRSTGFSVFWMDDTVTGHSTGIYQAVFRNIRYTLDPGTRSIEAWHVVTSLSDSTTDVTFEHVSGPVPTGFTGSDATMDNTQYQFYMTTSSASASSGLTNLTWRNCIMASAFGGIIKVSAARGVLIENVASYNAYDRAVTNPAYWLATSAANGVGVVNSVIRNCARTTSLGSGTPPPPYDVQLDSACKGILIENMVTAASGTVTPYINVGGASGVVILQPGGGGTPSISNPASDTIVIGQGAVTVGGSPLISAGASQTITGVLTFTASNVNGSVITDDITVRPNPGRSTSASMFLDNTAGEIWEFFNNAAGAFGVYDDTHSQQPFYIDGNITTVLHLASGGAFLSNGPLDINSAGFGLKVAEGSNCKQGTAGLNGTTPVVVSNSSVTANSRIFLTHQSISGVPGVPYISARTPGTSFSVTSTAATDLGTVAFEIFEPG